MRENKVVYGLIGYGGMGRWHTEILSNVPEAVIGGIYDIKEEKREEAKEKGFFVYETEEAMLADPDIDVVLIATPNDCHKPIAIRAMHAGKNVISEKPVTLSSADLLEMENAAKETGKLLTVHQNRRWDDDFLIIKKLVEEQKLGHVFRIESRVHGSRGIPGDWKIASISFITRITWNSLISGSAPSRITATTFLWKSAISPDTFGKSSFTMVSSRLGAMVFVRPAAVLTGTTVSSVLPVLRMISPFNCQSRITAVPSSPSTYHLGREI